MIADKPFRILVEGWGEGIAEIARDRRHRRDRKAKPTAEGGGATRASSTPGVR